VAQQSSLDYPSAPRGDVVDDYFGTAVADPYRWMEDLGSPELRRWADAQKALTIGYLDALPERDALKARITELWNCPTVTPPRYEGGRWFYARNTGLQRQSLVCMRETLDSPEAVVLDPNCLSPDGSIALSGFVPSPDGRHFAYGLSQGGSDWSTYYVRELGTPRQLPDEIRWVRSLGVAWTKDGNGFFYGRYPEPRPGKALQDVLHDKTICYHRIGTPQSADRVIYDRPDEPMLFIDVDVDEAGRYVFLQTQRSLSRNELLIKDLIDPHAPDLDAPAQPLYLGHTALYKPLGVVDGTLYLLTDLDASNRKVVAAPLDRPDPLNWTTIVPEAEHAIETARLVAGTLAVTALVDVAGDVRFYTLDGSAAGRIATPSLGSLGGPFGRHDRPEIFYTFTSPLYPETVFRFDLATGNSSPFEPPSVTFDGTRYRTERVFVVSKDGTRVPVFITHHSGLGKDGSHPAMLYAFGGFGLSELPRFRPEVIAFLERGGVYATANIRGGGEYGQTWHDAGTLERKQNVFDDFIAAAEYLVREGYASPQTLGIMGGSNGGLLVGAVMEQRPDLFAVALLGAAVLDMLRFHRFTGGVVGTAEYGCADNPAEFACLYKYSPVHNIKPGTCYPATLITTADHDDRVVPSHSFKFAATLQAAQGCVNPVLLRIETQASHAYRPTDKRIAELADGWAFALAHMCVRRPDAASLDNRARSTRTGAAPQNLQGSKPAEEAAEANHRS
jgi:prolyl oligopeptidase